ncbi:MAG: hypothetical protein DI586_05745 [Micavibrio aeruginosavorus]|uniref:TIGR02302 family protein n=1 Tax=Micavibrio aeruginosavorus TaxID=349221 RepID=A0A2W5FLE4_9BACT|nr:MAG: hypothetical protein DI586_05745 [Micavibrio aeruginosavorus]
MEKVAAVFQKLSLYAKIATAAISLFLENLIGASAFLFAWIAAFICLFLAGYASYFATTIFWLGALALSLWGVRKFSLPKRKQIIHRVELSSRLKHRPLSGLDDIPSTNGNGEFWHLEKNRQKDLLKNLRHSKPDLELSRRDPYALRIGFILILACAFFIAPSASLQNIKDGLLLPEQTGEKEIDRPFAQLRITPPSYAGMAPTILNQSSGQALTVLAGSKISAEVNASFTRPILKMGKENIYFSQKKDSDSWIIEHDMVPADKISITTLGIPRFRQDIKWTEDTAPMIGWNGDIKILPTGEMKIPLKIADDFGIKKLTLRGILAPMQAPPYFGSAIAIEKKMNISIRHSAAEINTVFDTTGHPWAGRKVSLMIEAEDYAGNISETAPLDFELPTRDFRNPVSTRLSFLRDNLLNLRGNARDIASSVEEILYRPDIYGWDNMMTLGLRSIDSRLAYSQSKDSLESVAAMMWQLALRMEDGNIAETQTSLKEALDNLQEALQRNADKTEIAELMQKMQQALVHHLQTLAQKMTQDGPNPQQPASNQNMNLGDLEKFMQDLQRQMMGNDKQGAMDKLNQLQQLAEMLGSSAAQGIPKDMQQMMENLQDLQNVIAEQKKLIDTTRESSEEKINALSADQKGLQERTSSISEKTGGKIKPLADAGNEMSLSAAALQNSEKNKSLSHQQKALDLLQQSQKQMQQQLQEKMKGMTMISIGGAQPGNQDPLGRSEGSITSGDTEVPEGATRKKSDEIIKTLREREGDMTRPIEERNYYQRLLKQW